VGVIREYPCELRLSTPDAAESSGIPGITTREIAFFSLGGRGWSRLERLSLPTSLLNGEMSFDGARIAIARQAPQSPDRDVANRMLYGERKIRNRGLTPSG
jgi:hypothetical protein